jgi:hypothetical protein
MFILSIVFLIGTIIFAVLAYRKKSKLLIIPLVICALITIYWAYVVWALGTASCTGGC